MIAMVLCCGVFTSCSDKDDKKKQEEPTPAAVSPIVGTWTCYQNYDAIYDNYVLVFNSDGTGYIRNEYGTRTSITQQMNFNWSLTTTSSGYYLLTVIYKSGDRDMDDPFPGSYAQWSRTCTIAGSTLSISTGDGYVMLFNRS